MSWALLAPAGWVLQGDVGRAPSWPASWRHHPSHPWRWVPARAALKGAQRARLLLLPEAGSCPSTPGALNIGTAGLWPPPHARLVPFHMAADDGSPQKSFF